MADQIVEAVYKLRSVVEDAALDQHKDKLDAVAEAVEGVSQAEVKLAKDIDTSMAALDQFKTFLGPLIQAEERVTEQVEAQSAAFASGTISARQYAEGLVSGFTEMADAYATASDEAKNHTETMERLRAVMGPLQAAQQQINEDIEAASAAFADGTISATEYEKTLSKLFAEMSQIHTRAAEGAEEVAGATDNASNATVTWADAIGLAKSALGTLGIATTIAGVYGFAKSTAEAAAALVNQSRAIGVTVEQLQTLHNVMKDVGTSTGIADRAVSKLNTQIGAVLYQNSKTAREELMQFGVTFEQMEAGALPVLEQIARATQNMGSQTEVANKLNALFGERMTRQLIPALAEYAKGFEHLGQVQAAEGRIISEDVAVANEQALNRMGKEWQRFQATFAPIIAFIMRILGGFGIMINFIGDAIDQGITQIVTRLRNDVQTLLDWVKTVFDSIRRGAEALGIVATKSFEESAPQEWKDIVARAKNVEAAAAAQAAGGVPFPVQQMAETATGYNDAAAAVETYTRSLEDLASRSHLSADEQRLANTLIEQANILIKDEMFTVNDLAEAKRYLGDETVRRITLAQAEIDASARQKAADEDAIQSNIKFMEAAAEARRKNIEFIDTTIARTEIQIATEKEASLLTQKNMKAMLDSGIKEYSRDFLETEKLRAEKSEQANQLLVDYEKNIEKARGQLTLSRRELAVIAETERLINQQRQLGVTLAQKDAEVLARKAVLLNEQREIVEDIQQRWIDVSRDIYDSFTTAFQDIFKGGKDVFEKLSKSIMDIFTRLLAEMAAQALIKPIIIPMVGGMMGATNLLGGYGGMQAGTGMLAGQGGGLFGSLLGGGGMAAAGGGLFGGIGSWLGGSKASFDSATGNWTPGAGGFGGGGMFGYQGFGLGSAFGGGLMGAGIGSLTGMVGGNTLGGTIGGTIGGVAGSLFGPLGSMAGGALGGLVGGMFGGKESNYRAWSGFSGDLTSFTLGGDKPNEQTTAAAQAVGQAISQVAQALKGVGVNLESSIRSVSIGARDQSYITTAAGQNINVGAAGDVQAAIKGTLDYVLKTASSTDENVQEIIKLYQAKGVTTENLQQFLADIDFAKTLQELSFVSEETSQWAQAVKAVNDQFGEVIKRATELGLSTENAIKAQADALAYIQKQFTATYQGQLDAITASTKVIDPYKAKLDQINKIMAEATKEAKALGFSLAGITQAAAAATAAVEAEQAEATAAEKAAKAAAKRAEAERKYAESLRVVAGALNEAMRAANDSAREAERLVNSWASAQKSLEDARRALFITDPTQSPLARYQAAQAEFGRLQGLTMGGDVEAAGELAKFATQFLQTSLSYNASSTSYARDFEMVQQVLEAAGIKAGEHKSAAQSQLDSINDAVMKLEELQEIIQSGAQVSVMKDQLAVAQATLNLLKGVPGTTTEQTGAYTNAQAVIEKFAPGSSAAGGAGTAAIGPVLAQLGGEVRGLRNELRDSNLQRRHGLR